MKKYYLKYKFFLFNKDFEIIVFKQKETCSKEVFHVAPHSIQGTILLFLSSLTLI